MANKWLDALKEERSKHNTPTALRVRCKSGVYGPDEKPETSKAGTDKTDKIASGYKNEGKKSETAKTQADKTDKNNDADHLGLIAAWSVEFGYVSLHDPTTGEWQDIRTKEAPSWAMWEARKRKEIYKSGNRKAFRLTSREMSEIWEAEHVLLTPEGIVEDHPIEEESENAP